jgi:NADH-quinone oxidoreductase subunit G
MEKIIIDTKKYKIENEKRNYLIYQYCYDKGIELPCFCYNENLEIAGNCRICLIEIEKMPKLLLACATKIEANMIIKTESKRLEKVRKSIVEFLLINHPLDCPVCDKGGECDLQNIGKKYGYNRGRFYELKKRSVIDKESGYFIKTIMTRCIHCTRCIRFYKEIVGIRGFGFVGRGESIEIITNKFNLLSVLSGNVIDLCPVGALTSKIYKFKGRSWELNKYENIDILDTMCSSICLNLRNNEILRILPVSDSLVNQDWITNITRYFFDALTINRLLKPFLILNKKFLELNWLNVTKIMINIIIKFIVEKKGIKFFLSDFLDLECLFNLKKLNLNLGYLNLNLIKTIYNNVDFNFFYLFNSELSNLKNYNLYFFLILNLRLKMPLLNTILRKKLKKKYILIYSLGLISKNISINIKNLGNNYLKFINILEKKNMFVYSLYFTSFFLSSFFSIKNYNKWALIVGEQNFFLKKTNKLLINFCSFFSLNYKNLYILFTNVIDLNSQEIFIKKNKILNNKFSLIYSFTFDIKKKKKNFTILQNSFFLSSLNKFNLLLPTSSFFEYSGLFLNFEGRIRKKLKIYTYKNINLKSNLEVLKYLNIIIGKKIFFFNFNFNLLVYYKNLLKNKYDFFFFYNYIILNLKNIFIKNFFIYKYNLSFENYIVFDNLINIYNFKKLYKLSFVLKKASLSLNNYLNIYNVILI